MFQTGSISTLFVLYIHPASNIVLKHITSSMPLMQRHTRPDGGTIPLLGVEACLLPSHTNFKPFFSRTILTLWTVRNKTAAKHYWKHFQLFTRLKGWNDTLNTSDFIIWAIFWWQSGIDLSKCWKLTIFQKVIIWLKALKLRAKKRCTFFSPFKSSYNLIKTIPSCPVIKTLILRYCSLPNILTFKCYEVLEEKNLC